MREMYHTIHAIQYPKWAVAQRQLEAIDGQMAQDFQLSSYNARIARIRECLSKHDNCDCWKL